jgi:copper chaperone CopZ
MFERLQPVQKREAGVTANVLIFLIDRMRVVAPLSKRYSTFKAHAYNTHGLIALDEGTEESARRAETHFEKNLKVYKAIGDVEGTAHAKINIALAKSKYDSGNNEELLRAAQELYEMGVAEFGEENEYTIKVGKHYASNLRKANRGDEARELLTKLLTTSKQVLGPDHGTTKEVESELKK